MTVLKMGDKRQAFDREKLIKSMQLALQKRPVAREDIEAAANVIVRQLETGSDAEVTSRQIGALVMDQLAGIDTVAYIRYASVYKDFRKPEDFDSFIKDVQKVQSRVLPHSSKVA